ncbi:MAG: amidohydrolase family protein, partial [Planctomycetes bacterium]|nr:amidohydrolase family protein [Planctomycetota bacterium]
MRTSGLALAALAVAATFAPGPAQAATSPATRTWRCRHVLAADGSGWLENVVVTTAAGKITAVRSDDSTTAADLDFGEAWMVPGLIDLHTHLLLRPYDERSWDDQVLHDSVALRSMRALHYAEATLLAGWVAVRDLGTEGADFADVALQQAFAEGVGRGPLLYAATRAIVQCGRYGPAPDDPKVRKGAQPVSGIDEIRTAVAEQIDGGAQWIKVYADYRYGEGGGVSPTFSLAELEALCAAAAARGRPVAAHATTEEGIRRAVLAGVRTIEHGAGASETTLALMRDRGVVLVPCLAANEAIVRYAGHQGPV